MNSAHVADALKLASSIEYMIERAHIGSGESQRTSTHTHPASAMSAAKIATTIATVERWLDPACALRAVVSGAPVGVSVPADALGVVPAGVLAGGVAGVVVAAVCEVALLGVVAVGPAGLGVLVALGVASALEAPAFVALAVALPRRSDAGIGTLGGLLVAARELCGAAEPVAASAWTGVAEASTIVAPAVAHAATHHLTETITSGHASLDRHMSGPAHPMVSHAVDGHPHARAILLGALADGSAPSHAYLFYGPTGAGKRTAARAFAAELLAKGSADEESVRARVWRDAHPDLTWVTPSGASELLVSDISERVVAAVAHTPLESSRRVFVIEAAGTMNDQAANRMLKTLEEPPPFAHLILLAEHSEEVLPTVASRCQRVRFDALSSAAVHEGLLAGGGLSNERALACARVSGGDGGLAGRLACEEGERLRAGAEGFVRAALDGRSGERRWMELLNGAREAGARANESVTERVAGEAEMLPAKERRRHERDGVEVARRAERRARTATLDLLLRLAELWLRDVWCVAIGAPELVFAVDRLPEISSSAEGRDASMLLRGVELVCDTRLRLALNVSEELALEALAYRLADLLS